MAEREDKLPFAAVKPEFRDLLPCYKQGQTLKQVIDAASSPTISPKFLKLPPDQFDPARPLYTHQLEAFRLIEEGHNLIVATGTGSGKTECFILPILQSIFANPSPGLRAILIYPMNALANDQLERLRRLLRDCPEVSFGRYTSDTPRVTQRMDSFANSSPCLIQWTFASTCETKPVGSQNGHPLLESRADVASFKPGLTNLSAYCSNEQ
jgi:ATP-dependent helicase YprA (DUF1998 family)